MPNWCCNELDVMGDGSKVAEFVERVKTSKSDLSFETTVPTCDDDDPDWYTKTCIAWGVNRDADEVDADGAGYYRFDSAWGPPLLWLARTALLYPDLTFRLLYKEPGMAFMGACEIENGVVTDLHLDYGSMRVGKQQESIPEFIQQSEGGLARLAM